MYIPNYNKPNPNLVGPPNASGHPVRGTSACESCEVCFKNIFRYYWSDDSRQLAYDPITADECLWSSPFPFS